jgi:hypothetical protein
LVEEKGWSTRIDGVLRRREKSNQRRSFGNYVRVRKSRTRREVYVVEVLYHVYCSRYLDFDVFYPTILAELTL